MFIVNTIFGGVFGGVVCSLLVALIASFLGFKNAELVVLPAFWATAPLIAFWIGWKTFPR